MGKLNVHHHNPRRRGAASAAVTRKDFTDRLGLPADATDEQVMAAIDTGTKPPAKAPAKAASTGKQPADDLYRKVYGSDEAAPIATADEALYERVMR